MVIVTNIFTYDMVSDPAFPNANLHISRNNIRKYKINKILSKTKKPLI